MNLTSPNPLVTLQKALRSKSRALQALAILALVAAVFGFFAAYLPSGSYFIERAGQTALGLAAVLYFLLDSALRAREEERLEARVDQAERAAAKHPERSGPLWDAARARLELYFQRNLPQARSIFWFVSTDCE